MCHNPFQVPSFSSESSNSIANLLSIGSRVYGTPGVFHKQEEGKPGIFGLVVLIEAGGGEYYGIDITISYLLLYFMFESGKGSNRVI